MSGRRNIVMAALAFAAAVLAGPTPAGAAPARGAVPAGGGSAPGEAPPGMVLIPAGTFLMGVEGEGDDSPVHEVRLGAFYLDIHEVTNAEYSRFCEETGKSPPIFWGIEKFRCGLEWPDHPVVGVSWALARDYAEWAGKRLPTEAEWEYAARGGLVGQPYPGGSVMDSTLANFRTPGTVPVGGFPPNGYGLYDMAGNAREWVHDFYGADYYRSSPAENPTGPESGKWHVVRGGGWFSGPSCQNLHSRNVLPAYWVDFNIGFRCARDVD